MILFYHLPIPAESNHNESGVTAMPKMIPERPSEYTRSSAEINLFPILRGMEGTDDWVILHSVAIAKHTTQSQGEADFVVVIPGSGVFSLEVKGGLIAPEDGRWYSTDREGVKHLITDPVQEVNEASHSFSDYVIANSPPGALSYLLFGFGVVFPNTTFHGEYTSVEIADEQIADYDDCLTPARMKAYLLRLADFWRRRKNTAVRPPNAEQCAAIVRLLRPSFEGRVALRSIIRSVENQVVELTENQQDIFETIKENSRCIVRGGAGTGKTIIALHHARQLAQEHRRTGFFCYNRQLSDHLIAHVEQSEHLVCGSYTEYMESVVRRAGKLPELPDDTAAKSRYYFEELPQLFMEAYLELELPPFDCLILDEAQDLMTGRYLESLDFILLNGIEKGNWYLFMDAERQNLYHKEKGDDVIALLDAYEPHYTKCTLRDNCRNSVAIIEKVDSIFGTTTRHRTNNERGAEVVVKTCKRSADQVAALEEILDTLEKEQIAKEQVVILSPVVFANSSASRVERHTISTELRSRDAVFFSTIHSFKGLESPVVIITDVDSLDYDLKRDLLYVGMTRAKSALYILASEKAARLINQGFRN